jgi:tetratricopeptide (TPR) repeat protein
LTPDESVLDDSFDVEQNSEYLLTYNKFLIEGLGHFSRKDLPNLITSYSDSLEFHRHTSRAPANIENVLILKSSLAVAYFLNSQTQQSSNLLNECLKTLESNNSILANRSETTKSLYIKILANKILVHCVENDIPQCNSTESKLISFLNEIPLHQRFPFIRESIYIFFRYQTLLDFDNDYIDSMKSHISTNQLGCFNMVMGLTKELKEDLEGALSLY